MPKVVVGMPVYNDASYLSEAIDSILQQSFRDFQLLIVDDGSNDTSADIVRSYNDPRIKLVQHGTNLGRPHARNTILRLADAQYLAWMDADDISLPQRLEKQVAFLDANSEMDICATQLKFFNEATGESHFSNHADELRAGLIFAPTIPNPCSCLRLDSIRKHNLSYRQNLRRAEDYGFWVDAVLFAGLRVNILPESLVLYRVFDRPSTPRYHKEVLRIILERLQIAYTEEALDAYCSFTLSHFSDMQANGFSVFLDVISEIYCKLRILNLVDWPTLRRMTNDRISVFFGSRYSTYQNYMQYCTWHLAESKMRLKMFIKYSVNCLLPHGSARREFVKKLCGRGSII